MSKTKQVRSRLAATAMNCKGALDQNGQTAEKDAERRGAEAQEYLVRSSSIGLSLLLYASSSSSSSS